MWEIGATFSTLRYHYQGRGGGLRAVTLGICDYFKQPLTQ